MFPRSGRPMRRSSAVSESSASCSSSSGPTLPSWRSFSAAGRGSGRRRCGRPGLAAARGRGLRVLSARASEAEARVSFAALIDLLDGVGREELAALPSPQLRALEVALLRTEATGVPAGDRSDRARLPQRAAGAGGAGAAAGRRRRRPVAGSSFGRGAGVRRAAARGRAGWVSARRASRESLRLGAVARAAAAEAARGRPAQPRRDASDAGRAPRAQPARGRSFAGCSRRRSETRSSPSSWDARWPRAGRRPSGRTFRCRRRSRTSWARAWMRSRSRCEGCCLPSPWAGTCACRCSRRSPDPAAIEEALDAGLLLVDGDRVRTVPPAARRRGEEPGAAGRAAGAPSRAGRRRRRRGTARAAPRACGRASGCRACRYRRGRGRHCIRPRCPHRRRRAGGACASPDTAGAGRAYRASARARRVSRGRGRAAAGDGPAAARGRLLASGVGARPRLAAARRRRRRQRRRAPRGAARAGARGDGGRPGCARVRAGEDVRARDRMLRQEDPRRGGVGAGGAYRARPGAASTSSGSSCTPWAGRASFSDSRSTTCASASSRASDAASYIAESPEPVVALRLLWRGARARGAGAAHAPALAGRRAGRGGLVRAAADEPVRPRAARGGLGSGVAAAGRVGRVRGSGAPDHADVRTLRALLAAGRGLPDEAERWAASALAGAERRRVRLAGQRGVAGARGRGSARPRADAGGREPGRPLGATQREGVEEPGAFPVAPDLVEALVELGETRRRGQ